MHGPAQVPAQMSPSKLLRLLLCLRVLGLLKRAANTYRYHLTRAGRLAIAALERITRLAIVLAMVKTTNKQQRVALINCRANAKRRPCW